MATKVTPVSQQVAWTIQNPANAFFTDSSALSGPDAYSHTDDIGNDWPTTLTGTGQRVQIDLSGGSSEANNLLLKFYGNPASAALDTPPTTVETGVVAIWGISELNGATEYMGDYLGQLAIDVGSKLIDVSAVLPDDNDDDPGYWVRRIEVQNDRSLFPAMRVVGQEGEAAPVLVVDTMGYARIIVEMRLTAAGGGGSTWSPVAADYLGFLYRLL